MSKKYIKYIKIVSRFMRNIPFMYQLPGKKKDLLYYFMYYPVSSDSSPPFLRVYMFTCYNVYTLLAQTPVRC